MNDSIRVSINRVNDAFERGDDSYPQLLNDAHKLAQFCIHAQSVIEAGETAIRQLEMAVKHSKDCRKCNGTGQVHRAWNNDYVDCDSCNGRGH